MMGGVGKSLPVGLVPREDSLGERYHLAGRVGIWPVES